VLMMRASVCSALAGSGEILVAMRLIFRRFLALVEAAHTRHADAVCVACYYALLFAGSGGVYTPSAEHIT
jgi:hypothetical protein